MKFARALITIIGAILIGFTALAEEVIKSFDTDILVENNGDFIVTETITVNVERNKINRGIFRDLPNKKEFKGAEIPVRYSVLSIKRNGQNEPYTTDNIGNAYRIRIGDADRFLSMEYHTYEITYRIKDEIRRDDTFDEVYWNVTGNYWDFPIERASARITMPNGAIYQSHNSWGGPIGSTLDITRFSEEDGVYVFNTTRPLAEREGITVSLRVDKGIMLPEPGSTRWFLWWLRNGAVLILSCSFLGIITYYYRSWNKVGRDPAKDPVFARYEPPKGYSAAAASHIYYRGNRGHKALTASLMELAIKKWINIDTDKKKTVLTRLDDDQRLDTADEQARHLYNRLFKSYSSDTITLKKKPHSHFNSANSSLRSHLSTLFGKPYFRLNIGYIIAGIFLTIIAVVFTVSQISQLTPLWIWALLAALIVVNILFFILMPAPTRKGQKTRAEIEGLRLYLKTAEKQKFDSVDIFRSAPPPMSVERYESLLPYAIALGVEDPWSEYFEKVMPIEAKNYDPHWNNSGSFRDVSSMTSNMVSGLSAGATSAAPQSSSSSGGGGFSGGGGGGGGGGGW